MKVKRQSKEVGIKGEWEMQVGVNFVCDESVKRSGVGTEEGLEGEARPNF
jgi:hypothetical protein